MNQRVKWLLVVVGTIAWVLVIYPAYYVVHKPLTPARATALLSVITDLATWLVLLTVALALGSKLTRRLNYDSLLERAVFSCGLGLGIFALVTLGLSLAGLLHGWLFWVLLLGTGLLLIGEFRSLILELRRLRPSRPKGAWTILLGLFIAISLLLVLTLALVPPTEWDSLTYHLEGPERYLEAGRMTFELDNYYLFFPALGEMLFLAGLALKSDIVPRLLHFGFLLLTLGALGAFAKRYWRGRHGLVAGALFLSIPTALIIASWSYVDLTMTFYALAAVYALLNWLPTSEPRPEEEPGRTGRWLWLVLAGLAAGACMSIKYTGAGVLLALGAIVVWTLLRRRISLRQTITAVLVTGCLALLLAAPWYIKNTLVTGNPVYPLIWGGQGWNDIATRWLLAIGQEMNLLDLAIVPWTLTVLGTQGSVYFDATYSPVFLLLLPLLLFVRRRARGLVELLLAALVGYLLWLASGAASYGTYVLQGRFLLWIFAPLSLLCAFALEGMDRWDVKSFSLQRVLKMIVALTLAVGLLNQMLIVAAFNPVPYLLGSQSREQYLDDHTSLHFSETRSYLNANLSEADSVLFVWEPRSYGVIVPHEADVLFDNFGQAVAHYGSAQAIAEGLHHEGYTHLLVNNYIYPSIKESYPITAEELSTWQAFQEQFLTKDTLVHAEEEFLFLYRLPAAEGP